MSRRDLISDASSSPQPIDWFDFEKFLTRDRSDQEKIAAFLLIAPSDHAASIPKLGYFLDWISKNVPHSRHLLKSFAKNLLADCDPELLVQNPSIGKTLGTLYWNGNRSKVKKTIRKLLSLDNPHPLASNPDLPAVIHIAKTSRSHARLVRFGAKIIEHQADQTLRENPSLKAVLGEFDSADVRGIREFVERTSISTENDSISETKKGTHNKGNTIRPFNGPGFLSDGGSKCVKHDPNIPMIGTDIEIHRSNFARNLRPHFGRF